MTMNFDSNAYRLQGVLMNLHKTGSNEAIAILREVFNGCPKDACDSLTFFLLLNTKMSITEELKDDVNVGLMVEVCPLLDMDLFIEIIFECQLEDNLMHIILNSHSLIIIEILDVLTPKLKTASFHKEHYGMSYLSKIIFSIFGKLCKINCFKEDQQFSKSLFQHFKELVQLNEDIVCTSTKLSPTNIQFARFTSFKFYNFFLLLKESCLGFVNPRKNLSCIELFEITVPLVDKEKKIANSKIVQKAFDLLLKSCSNVLQLLTLDLWISLAEMSGVGKNHDDQNAQQVIGEIVYMICNIIEQNNIQVNDETLYCLSQLKLKPYSEDEIISNASLEQVIDTLQRGKGSLHKWFKALIQNVKVYEDVRNINHIFDHIKLADADDLSFLLSCTRSCFKFLILDQQKLEELQFKKFQLFLLVFKKCPLDVQLEYFSIVIGLGTEDLYFDAQLMETFNKIVTLDDFIDKNFSDILCLCIQSPYRTIRKICMLVISTGQSDDCVTLLQKLEDACFLKCFQMDGNIMTLESSNLLSHSLKYFSSEIELNEREEVNLCKFILSLKTAGLLDACYLRPCVLDVIYENIQTGQWKKVVLHLQILQGFLSTDINDLNKASLFVFLAQILEAVSWDFISFTSSKADVRESVSSILKTCPCSSLDSKNDVTWLRQQLSSLWIINQAYFCDAWLKHDITYPASDDLSTHLLLSIHSKCSRENIISGIVTKLKSKPQFEVDSSLQVSLYKILPCLIADEWLRLINPLKKIVSSINSNAETNLIQEVIRIFTTTMYLLCLDANSTDNSSPCLEFCIRNFGRLIQKLLPEISFNFFEILKGLVWVLGVISEQKHRSSCCMILSPILFEFTDLIVSSKEGTDLKDEVISLVSHIKTSEIEKVILAKLCVKDELENTVEALKC